MTRVKEVEPGSGDMPAYKSHPSRLVHSLRKGYDNVRKKLAEARGTVKYYQIRERDLEKSRTAWKEKSQERETVIEELEKKIKALEKENTKLETELKEVKKKEIIENSEALPLKACGYKYNVEQIFLSIRCALEGATGFRPVSRIFSILQDILDFAPAFSTIREWVLKLGLFMLGRPKEKGEWIYVIDTSIQVGLMKCLLIVGVPLARLLSKREEKESFIPSHEDMEPLVIKTIDSCNGEVVRDALLEAEQKTGGAISVVSDEASEIKRGVRLFRETGREIIHQHDIVHRIDLIIKKEIEEDAVWSEYTKQMTNTTLKLKLTEIAHLIPPKQRQKRRMLGEIAIVEWGRAILDYLDRENVSEIAKEKLDWVRNYRSFLIEYEQIVNVSKAVIEEVHNNGYYYGITDLFEKTWSDAILSPRVQLFCSKIINILREEESKVPLGKRLLGSSEGIESIFGKFKQLEKDHASRGFTSLVLSLPAMMGEISQSIVQSALETISIENVWDWVDENLGRTFFSKRRRDLGNKKDIYLDTDELSESAI